MKKSYSIPIRKSDAWLAEERADGWIYGPMKDSSKKEHPCLVPYEKLPIEQRVKTVFLRRWSLPSQSAVQ